VAMMLSPKPSATKISVFDGLMEMIRLMDSGGVNGLPSLSTRWFVSSAPVAAPAPTALLVPVAAPAPAPPLVPVAAPAPTAPLVPVSPLAPAVLFAPEALFVPPAGGEPTDAPLQAATETTNANDNISAMTRLRRRLCEFDCLRN